MTAVSSRLEDYLEALFLLETTGSRQTVTALAENLKLTKGTIATVIKKMTEQELVLHESYGAIRLTPKGRRIGWQVYMKHERLTSFFHDLLGQDAERSEEIACLIEHHLDGAAANRFFNLIDFLQRAQSEKKEWTKELFKALDLTVNSPMPLTLAVPQITRGRVCRITAEKETVSELGKAGIVPEALIENAGYDGKTGKYAVYVNGNRTDLEFQTAATVWIV